MATAHQPSLPEAVIHQRNCEDRRVPPQILICNVRITGVPSRAMV